MTWVKAEPLVMAVELRLPLKAWVKSCEVEWVSVMHCSSPQDQVLTHKTSEGVSALFERGPKSALRLGTFGLETFGGEVGRKSELILTLSAP